MAEQGYQIGIEYALMELIAESHDIMSRALAYFDGYRTAWLPANLIQAQLTTTTWLGDNTIK